MEVRLVSSPCSAAQLASIFSVLRDPADLSNLLCKRESPVLGKSKEHWEGAAGHPFPVNCDFGLPLRR